MLEPDKGLTCIGMQGHHMMLAFRLILPLGQSMLSYIVKILLYRIPWPGLFNWPAEKFICFISAVDFAL